MKLQDIIKEEHILIHEEEIAKEEALKKLSDFLHESNAITSMNSESIYSLVMERESIMSTGIGKGVAIAHCNAEKLVNIEGIYGVLGVFPKGIDYDSQIDDIPVRIVFLLLAEKKEYRRYLSLIATICRIFKDEQKILQVLSAQSCKEIALLIENIS